MPNMMGPIGSPWLRGGDLITQFLNGYMGAQPYGSGGYNGAGVPSASDVQTRDLMLSALASGQPVSQIARTPDMGGLTYGLSRIGLLSPNVQANPQQMAMEQLALKQQRLQNVGEMGDIFASAANIAKVDPKLAEQFYAQAAPQVQGMAPVSPDTFQGIFTTTQLALKRQQDLENYHMQMEQIAQQRADTQEKMANARDAREAAALSVQMGHLNLMQQTLQQSIQREQTGDSIKLISALISSGDPTMANAAKAMLLKLSPGLAPVVNPPAASAPSSSGSLTDRLGAALSRAFPPAKPGAPAIASVPPLP